MIENLKRPIHQDFLTVKLQMIRYPTSNRISNSGSKRTFRQASMYLESDCLGKWMVTPKMKNFEYKFDFRVHPWPSTLYWNFAYFGYFGLWRQENWHLYYSDLLNEILTIYIKSTNLICFFIRLIKHFKPLHIGRCFQSVHHFVFTSLD